MLRTLIGNHTRVIAPTEMWLLQFPTYSEWRLGKPVAISSVIDYLEAVGQPHTAPELDERCRSWSTSKVYRWLIEMLPEGHVLVDKTPGYTKRISTLESTLQFEGRYLWLIRHPLGVIDSDLRLRKKQADDAERSWMGSAWYTVNQRVPFLRTRRRRERMERREALWREQNSNVHRFLTQHPTAPYLKISYEEMVADSARVVSSVCAFLGLAHEPGLTDVAGKGDIPANLGDPTFGQFTSVSDEPVKRWKKRFSVDDLSSETRQLMRQIGVAQEGGFV